MSTVPESCVMACPLCGDGHGGPVLASEMFTGSVQAACFHGGCSDCLRDWVDSQIPQCRQEGILRVRCPEPGCTRMMAQQLVLQVSEQARAYAREVDRMENCRDDNPELQVVWQLEQPCSLCLEIRAPLLRNNACDHLACEGCWQRWADAQMPLCRSKKRTLRCVGPGCAELLEGPLGQHLGAGHEPLGRLQRELKLRCKLQQNKLYPAELQVECHREGCVGLGYLGYDTVMCFICEHQWPAWTPDAAQPEQGLPDELKYCPSCKAPIEKNGGCNHMTCRCGHEFYWNTLLPYGSGGG